MSVHYVVKLSISILKVNGICNCEQKKHQNVLLYLLQNEGNILMAFSEHRRWNYARKPAPKRRKTAKISTPSDRL